MEILLPEIEEIKLEDVLLKRRSIREYSSTPLTLKELSHLLFAAYGITDSRGFKTVPSAGATYPLEIYVNVRDVVNLEEGVYKYIPEKHSIVRILDEEVGQKLALASLKQMFIAVAPIVIIIAADFERTTRVYGDRGFRYVYMEVGHVAQNIYLMATSLGLGTVSVGAFYDSEIKNILGIDEYPLLLMPVGVPLSEE
ncbi:SagB-type dehydrogenase domain protein [Methanocaldococcus lauensis]|uniref:SagB-type dehydrogenase domain protein n=1 Tax=Methanocaldococcus lauensis TaxID=2546128 RepID=A0A8D6PUQ6_9EURY|nr:SagB/ThcOx family dehydrogenase [Methanocaldococcus lauensis]CAB3287626.1 SagB-type dehydrogenase domain protein [Methanocaldococcus lauensis]